MVATSSQIVVLIAGIAMRVAIAGLMPSVEVSPRCKTTRALVFRQKKPALLHFCEIQMSKVEPQFFKTCCSSLTLCARTDTSSIP
jgi:hypothetical protein